MPSRAPRLWDQPHYLETAADYRELLRRLRVAREVACLDVPPEYPCILVPRRDAAGEWSPVLITPSDAARLLGDTTPVVPHAAQRQVWPHSASGDASAPPPDTIGRTVQLAILKAGLSRRECARRARIPLRRLDALCERNAIPDPAIIHRLAAALPADTQTILAAAGIPCEMERSIP